IAALKEMSSAEQKTISRALNEYAKGSITALDVLRAIAAVVKDKVEPLIKASKALRRVFSADLRTFRDAELLEGYTRYLKRVKDRPAGPLDPVSWALAQTRDRLRRALEREFGLGYREILKDLVDKGVVKTVTPEAIEFMRRFGGTVGHYRDLKKL